MNPKFTSLPSALIGAVLLLTHCAPIGTVGMEPATRSLIEKFGFRSDRTNSSYRLFRSDLGQEKAQDFVRALTSGGWKVITTDKSNRMPFCPDFSLNPEDGDQVAWIEFPKNDLRFSALIRRDGTTYILEFDSN